jgi:hypothetical protein
LAARRTRQFWSGAAVFAAFVLLLGFSAAPRKLIIPIAATAILAALSIWNYRRESLRAGRAYRLHLFYGTAAERLNGEWTTREQPDDEFAAPDHVYARDLNVLGDGSLLQYLCTARSGMGRRGLAKFLLSAPPTAEEIRLRQEAVRELAPRRDLRERIGLLGGAAATESRWEVIDSWLRSPLLVHHAVLRLALLATSLSLIALITAPVAGLLPWLAVGRWIVAILGFHAIAGILLRRQINRMKITLAMLNTETQVLRGGLRLLRKQHFNSAVLSWLHANAAGASASLRWLELLLQGLAETNTDIFYLPSLPVMAGTQLCMAVDAWRKRHGEQLRKWMDVWAEFEALNCLACYAWENPDHTYPEIAGEETLFEARALGHPLLPPEECVRNNVELSARSRFYIISGSNMSGKSTLLRAIGLNAVLAFAGAPVRAESMRISPVAVCASLSVVDSLLAGKSKFLAEVERLRQTIEASQTFPVLFLIDEIFSGTNSRDRRAASEAVVRILVSRGSIGAISTHDLSLAEIAEDPALQGANVHMGSRDGSDPMDFDYLLKPGVTKERNALAIARMAGVPV